MPWSKLALSYENVVCTTSHLTGMEYALYSTQNHRRQYPVSWLITRIIHKPNSGNLLMLKALTSAGLLATVLFTSAFLAPASDAAAPSGPKKAYQSYLRSLYYAKDLNDVSGYWINRKSSLWNGMKNESKKKKLDYLKSTTYVGSYKFVSEKVEGNNAHVVVSGINVDSNKRRVKAQIEAELVKEDGYWKISDTKESYVGRPVVASR